MRIPHFRRREKRLKGTQRNFLVQPLWVYCYCVGVQLIGVNERWQERSFSGAF